MDGRVGAAMAFDCRRWFRRACPTDIRLAGIVGCPCVTVIITKVELAGAEREKGRGKVK